METAQTVAPAETAPSRGRIYGWMVRNAPEVRDWLRRSYYKHGWKVSLPAGLAGIVSATALNSMVQSPSYPLALQYAQQHYPAISAVLASARGIGVFGVIEGATNVMIAVHILGKVALGNVQ